MNYQDGVRSSVSLWIQCFTKIGHLLPVIFTTVIESEQWQAGRRTDKYGSLKVFRRRNRIPSEPKHWRNRQNYEIIPWQWHTFE